MKARFERNTVDHDYRQAIYEILKQNRTMDTASLFSQYRKTVTETVTDRSYGNYMSRMVELGVVRETGSGRWKKYEISI